MATAFRISAALLVAVAAIASAAFGAPAPSGETSTDGRPARAFEAVRAISAYLIPSDSGTLWGALWVGSVVTGNVYAQYLFTSFLWLDCPAAIAADEICNDAGAGRWGGYCAESQMIASFYSTLAVHSAFRGDFPPGWLATAICAIGFVVSTVSLITTGTCSVGGAAAATVIGLLLGFARVAFFEDFVVRLRPRGCKIPPLF